MGSARINAIRQRLAQSDLDWDDIFRRSMGKDLRRMPQLDYPLLTPELKKRLTPFSLGIEGLKGKDHGFMSPKGIWIDGNVWTEYQRNDFDELSGADSLTDLLNEAKEGGLINEQVVEKYSMEDGVLDFYEDTGFGMTKGNLGHLDSSENKLYWDSPKMPTPQQTATFKKMIETNRVNPENVHTNIWSGPDMTPNTQFRKSLKLKKYKPEYTDIQGYQVTPAAYKRITESGFDESSGYYGYDPQDPDMIKHLKYRAEHPEEYPSAEQMKEVRKLGVERKEENRKRHYKQRAKKYGRGAKQRIGKLPINIKGIKTWDDLLRKHVPYNDFMTPGASSFISQHGEVYSNAGLDLDELERIAGHDDIVAYALDKEGYEVLGDDAWSYDYVKDSKAIRGFLNPKHNTKGRYPGEHILSLETSHPFSLSQQNIIKNTIKEHGIDASDIYLDDYSDGESATKELNRITSEQKRYGKSARIEALRQRMAYDPPEEDILGSSILEKADAFEIHKQPHTIPPSRLMKKNIHAKDKIGAAFENFLGGDDVNLITGEEYKSQLDEIIRKGYIGENVDRTKKYRLDRTNKLPHQRTKDVAQGWTRDYIQKHKLAKLRQRLALTGNIKKYNKEKHKQEIREDTIAQFGIWAEPPVSAELGLERYKKRGRSKLKHRKDWYWKNKEGNKYQEGSRVFQKGEANMRDVDNPIIGESKRWNKKERDIIKTPTYKGDRVSNIRGPSNKYGLKQREMKNLKEHLDRGSLTQKRYDQKTTRPRYPKERIVEQMGLFGPIKDNLWRDDPTGADMITNFDEMVKNSPPVENISDIVYKDVHELDDPDRYAKQRIAYTGGSHYDEAITRLQKDWEGMEKGIFEHGCNPGFDENCGLSSDTIIKKLESYGLDPGDPEENDPDFKEAEMWRENGNYTGPGMERSRGYSEVNRFQPIEDGQPGQNIGSGVGHAWVRLDDGTIIDGSSGQFMGEEKGYNPKGENFKSTRNIKHRNRLRIIPPNSKLQQYYEADPNDTEERFYKSVPPGYYDSKQSKSARIQMARERLALIDRPNYKRPGEWFVGDISTFEKHQKKYEEVKGKRRIPSERVSFKIVDDATFSQRSPRKKSPFHKRMMRLNKDRKTIPKEQKILNRKREVFPEHRDLTPNFQKKHEVGSDELGFTNKEAERLTGKGPNYHGSFSKLRQRIGAIPPSRVEGSSNVDVLRRGKPKSELSEKLMIKNEEIFKSGEGTYRPKIGDINTLEEKDWLDALLPQERENVKKYIKHTDDLIRENIPVISKSNAKKWAKLRQRIGRL